MKLFFPLFLFLSFSFYAIAQKGSFEIGLHISPSFTKNSTANEPPTVGLSSGLFLNYNLSDRIIGGGGLEWATFSPENSSFFFHGQNQFERFNFFRVPFWFKVNLNDSLESQFQYFLTVGYTYGKITNAQQAINDYGLLGLNDNVHFARFGLECKFYLFEEIKVTLGPHVEWTNIYDIRYGDIYNFQFVIQIGKMLK